MSNSWHVRSKLYFIIGLGVVLAACIVAAILYLKSNGDIVELGQNKYRVEIADSPSEREQGLSNRTSLGQQSGMLFIFDEPGKNCFWMKDMRFNIDILWFNSDKKLVDKRINLSPDSYPTSFCPNGDAQYVLEVPANEASDFEIGEQAILNF